MNLPVRGVGIPVRAAGVTSAALRTSQALELTQLSQTVPVVTEATIDTVSALANPAPTR